ncbi:MAG: acetate--CoA ligase family protein [Acidimicrobiia bacterium]
MPTLSEAESKALVAAHGIPVPDERIVPNAMAAVEAATAIGFPVVLKLNGDAIAHKTERGLVRLNLADAMNVEAAASELLAAATPDDGPVSLLVAPMLRGNRELIAGIHRDAQFGPTVMLGIGGILAEAVGDVAFRLVPLTTVDAQDLVEDLQTQKLLGAFRGEPAVDRDALTQIITGLAALAEARPDVVSVDLNPLIVVDGRPIAVDALVEIRA